MTVETKTTLTKGNRMKSTAEEMAMAWTVVESQIGNGRYKAMTMELLKDMLRTGMSLPAESEHEVLLHSANVARAAISEFAREMAKADAAKGKVSVTYTLSEAASIKLPKKAEGEERPALDLIHAINWLNQASKHHITCPIGRPTDVCRAWMQDIEPMAMPVDASK